MPRLPVRLSVLAAAAALAAPLAARAASPDAVHVLSVALPDGSVARIHYVGDVPPSLTVRPPPAAAMAAVGPGAPFFVPAGFAAPFGADPFAVLARMNAAMQRDAAAMLVRAAAVAAAPSVAGTGAGTVPVALVAGPPGACFEGERVTAVNGAAPLVVSFRSAGCGAGAAPAAFRGVPAPRPPFPQVVPGAARPRPDPRLIEARADSAPLG